MTTRYDYYQNESTVFISVYRKKIVESDLKVDCTERALKVQVGDEVILYLERLWAEVVVNETERTIFGTKLEIRLKKSQPGVTWTSLIRSPDDQSGNTGPSVIPNTTTTSSTSPPTSQTRPQTLSNKFSNLDAALEAELDAEDSTEEGAGGTGGAGAGKSEKDLEAFFKSIYGDLGEEGKRAMMKSFTESGGTVLSTDWGDVGARKVVPQPPK